MWSPLVCSILGFSLMPAHAAGSNPESQRIQRNGPQMSTSFLRSLRPKLENFTISHLS